jgi:hypothetical protein
LVKEEQQSSPDNILLARRYSPDLHATASLLTNSLPLYAHATHARR